MSHPAPGQLYDLREWLLDRIDGSIETRGDDGLISDFIRQIDAQDAELNDIKRRLLPQFQGRAQRAEHERDALLEQLIVHRTTIANLHSEIDGMQNAAPSATAATDRPDWAQQLPGAELYDRDHGYDRTASLNAGHYVCLCGGACSHHTTKERV